ncbi:hypothetical protein [Cognatiyoonia sp. IB215182]|uniref:alpha/beta hydrolase family esterase n=1 Tax=Cognatiyoonia sp. IB215182 TaxID=3097353 RepID=UPI002A0EE0C4|nr:hypothetical protein [Cognatiyoonia sp. IB215182]MDX8355570.1 hypothetical protein [Cognatiyoonia sp. IB215182]
MILFFGVALLAAWELTTIRPKGKRVEIDCQQCGPERFFLLYAGSGNHDAKNLRDLIIVVHGFGSTAERTIATTRGRYEELALSGNAVVVHAQSEKTSANWFIGDLGSIPNYDGTPPPPKIDDFAYFDALWAEALLLYPFLERVHLIGMSRGAMASYALTCAQRLPVASLTAFTMPMPEMAVADCAGVSGVDFTLVNGTRDQLVPFYGGAIQVPWLAFAGERQFGQVTETDDTLLRWTAFNGCNRYDVQRHEQNEVRDGTIVVTRLWLNCAAGTVAHIRIVGGGHRWDNERWNPLAWAILGRTSREAIDAGPFAVELTDY